MTEVIKPIWREGVTLDTIRAKMVDTMTEHVGIDVIELGPDYLKGSMPVDSRTCQPMRILHGGASVVLAESLGSWAANSVIDITRFACVGQEINANHLRPVPVGQTVTGVTRPIHIGARSQVWSIEIYNQRQQLTCISRLTMAIINR